LSRRTPPDDLIRAICDDMKEVGATVDKMGAGDVLRFGDVSAQCSGLPSTERQRAFSRNNDSIMF